MKVVIFDMDGVIINSEPLHFEIEGQLLEELGGKFDRKSHEAFVGTTDYSIWMKLKEQFNLKPSVEEIIHMKKERFLKRIDEVQLTENFMDFMLTLYNQGYSMAIASSNNRKIVDAIVKRFGLGKYIKYIISGEEVKKGKPDPEIFLTVAKKIDVKPEECLVVEDAENGVKAAKAAGMKCIGLKNMGSGNQDLSLADLVISNFNQLNLEIIKNL